MTDNSSTALDLLPRIPLRTTDPIESPFTTVKARACQTKVDRSRKAGLVVQDH
jgi:hypothetical protein